MNKHFIRFQLLWSNVFRLQDDYCAEYARSMVLNADKVR